MTRLPVAVFATLVAATVGAFFVTQHLKVKNPLINGSPRPDPPAINPVAGRVCRDLVGRRVSFKRTKLNFFLQSRSDNVGVYVVDSDGDIVDAIGSRYMLVNRRYTFTWNGHETDGQVAPDGTYYFRIALQAENRTFELTDQPVRVITTLPRPDVERVSPDVVGPPGHPVTIRYRPGRFHNADIVIYRTDVRGKPVKVKAIGINGRRGTAVWDGLIRGRPAPAGTYLVGLDVTDQACNPGRFPVVLPPPAGSTPHAGVTVRYLAAQPPLAPVTAGAEASVLVDSRRRPYTWKLFRAGAPKVLARGRSIQGAYTLHVRIPANGAGLYALSLRSGSHRTVVPIAAAAGGRRAAARVLVVLPALTWQGANPVDDLGDGLPDTLSAGDQIRLARPLADGLPPGFDEELALLTYLDRHRIAYQLTTDVALAEGAGPALSGHTGVVLDGSLVWLPSNLGAPLRAFAQDGGTVLSLGTGSLQAQARLSPSAAGPTAGPPRPLVPDPFGARHGSLLKTAGALITVLGDRLGLFGATIAFPGYFAAQTISPPNGAPASLAGIGAGAPSITAFRLGRGTVVEVGLQGFASGLAHNVDAQELLRAVWRRLVR